VVTRAAAAKVRVKKQKAVKAAETKRAEPKQGGRHGTKDERQEQREKQTDERQVVSPVPSFEILEHTADIGLRVHAPSLEEMFSTAALALQSLFLDAAVVEPRNRYPMRASGEDPEALLVNWLNEMIYLLDGKRVAAARIEVTALHDSAIEANAWGEPIDRERHHTHLAVKAATYHQLKIVQQKTGWLAEVFLDI
jgi:SHS2 domain-containing protein